MNLGQLALGLLIGLFCFDRVVMPRVVHHGRDATVPDLSGRVRDEVRELLRAARLQVGDVMEVSDPEILAGRVVSQDPPPGLRVRRSRRVDLVVSRGRAVSRVPDLAGQTIRSARLALEGAGLQQGAVLSLPSDAVRGGEIIGTYPVRGSTPGPDGRVNLLVSEGPFRNTYLMPDLRGLLFKDAAARLSAAGILVAATEVLSEGRVYVQRPEPGAPIATGESVELQ